MLKLLFFLFWLIVGLMLALAVSKKTDNPITGKDHDNQYR